MKFTSTFAHQFVGVRPVLAGLATLCVAAASLPVRAGDLASQVDPAKKTVEYGDLNLASTQGVGALYVRINAASELVCRGFNGGSLKQKEQFSICKKQALARAVAAVDQPALTALLAIKTGQHVGTATLAQQ